MICKHEKVAHGINGWRCRCGARFSLEIGVRLKFREIEKRIGLAEDALQSVGMAACRDCGTWRKERALVRVPSDEPTYGEAYRLCDVCFDRLLENEDWQPNEEHVVRSLMPWILSHSLWNNTHPRHRITWDLLRGRFETLERRVRDAMP